MSELRFDPTTGDWVIFAPLRQLRPHAAAEEGRSAASDEGAERHCPFCPGNEEMTPKEIDVVRAGPEAAWRIRVIPNRFPALQIEEDHHRVELGTAFYKMGGCGAHEVVIESPDHSLVLALQPVEQIVSLLQVLQRRYVDLLRDRRFQSIVIFKNHGVRAGTSLRHPHWQIIATPVVPRMLRLRYTEAAQYFDRTGDYLYEVLLQEELEANRRIVASNQDFVAFMPFASHQPFETWLMPRRPATSFGAMEARQVQPLAELLKAVLTKLYVALENPDFNLTIDTASRGDEDDSSFCWHMRILPRLTMTAGFELGSGMSINTVLPEDAARFLTSDSAS